MQVEESRIKVNLIFYVFYRQILMLKKGWFSHRRFNVRCKEKGCSEKRTHSDCELQTNIVDLQPTVSSTISADTIKSNISQGYFSIDNQQDLSRSSINYSCSSSTGKKIVFSFESILFLILENDFKDFLICDESSSSSC